MRRRRNLGSTQRKVLNYLAQNEKWSPDCGWFYDSVGNTDSVLQVLCRHGLAKCVGRFRSKFGIYVITDSGKNTFNDLQAVVALPVDKLPKKSRVKRSAEGAISATAP